MPPATGAPGPRIRIGAHALVWAGGWSEAECRRAVEGAAAAGYDFVEIPALDPYAIDTAMTRRALEAAGIGATVSLGLSFDADISSADRDVADRGERLLGRALDVAVEVGATHLCGVIYGALGRHERMPEREAAERSAEALARLAGRAGAAGVMLALEPVNRYESNLLNTAEQALAMVSRIGAPGVGVHLDSYHMNIEEAGLAGPVRRCGERLAYVHVGESHRGYLGTGTIDFGSLFAALAEIGYAGPIAFESFSSRVVSPQLSTALAIWRGLWDDSDDLARHARAFVDAGLRAAAAA